MAAAAAAAARLEAVNERVRVVAERDALTRDVRAYARDGACSTVPCWMTGAGSGEPL